MQNEEKSEHPSERFWGSGLITLGLVLFAVVSLLSFAMIRDPGGYYDEWVPTDEVEGPEASYDWASSGLAVEFIDTSEIGDTPIQRWKWDFGDGESSDMSNPSHTFADAGEWDVTLDVTDEGGRVSKAEGTVEVEVGGNSTGDGSIGLADLADNVVHAVERSTKGALVVALVIGLFLVLTLVGARLVRYGVRLLRPGPDKIKVKLRPKVLELAVAEHETSERDPVVETAAAAHLIEAERISDDTRQDVPAPV